MSRIRKIAAGIAVLWMVAVLVIGVGGTWLQNNPEAFAEGSLAIAGIEAEEMGAQRGAASERRQEKIEARKFKGDGWGDDAVSGQAGASDWGD